MKRYQETIRSFVIENFLFGKDDGNILENTAFLESGIVDSTGILELVAFIEETYGITLEDAEIIPENLNSLKNISQFLERKLGAGAERVA